MKIWVVVWWLCSISNNVSTVKVCNNCTYFGDISNSDSNPVKMGPSLKTVEKKVSTFDTKEDALDFAKHSEYRSDCSTSTPIVYELVEVKK